jgi:hypothetical protein
VAKIRSILGCTLSGQSWEPGVERAECENEDHQHRVFEVHHHLDLVVLPDGTTLTAASFDPEDPYSRDPEPDYGLYLDSRWQPPWDHSHIEWPDFGVPENTAAVRQSLTAVLGRARSGQRVELGCLGGHGRTVTALACLAVLSGHSAGDAMDWVRANYCSDAVETPEQEALVVAVGQT